MARRVYLLLHSIAAFAILLGAHRVAVQAVSCTALKENYLTSDGCPNDCALCVLYSPSQKTQCPTNKVDMTCKNATNFVVPNTTGPACEITYLCQDSGESYVTIWTDTVTAVQSTGFKYPSKATMVFWAGMENLDLPDDVFVTPDRVTDLQFMFYDFSSQLERVTWNPHIKSLLLGHSKLEQVPSSLAKLNLTKLDMSGNSLTTFPSYPSLNGIQELDLSFNSFSTIPDAIYTMPKLWTLNIGSNNLQNVVLNATQFAFLKNIGTLKMNALVTSCPTGYDKQAVGNGSVCVENNVTTPPVPTTTTPTTPPPTKPATRLSAAVIAGIVVGVLAVLVALIVLLRRCWRPVPTPVPPTPMPERNEHAWTDPELLAVRLPADQVEDVRSLSFGSFGEVWLGKFNGRDVALKRLLSHHRTVQDAITFAEEIKAMARLNHPRIVEFIGATWTGVLDIQAVTEYLPGGDLSTLLHSNVAASLTWPNQKIRIAIDIADALVYLHSLDPIVMHRDLKPRNVLMDGDSRVKLSDFGVAKTRATNPRTAAQSMTLGVGTAGYIAPEVLQSAHYNESIDIYSFGALLSALDTHKDPYHDAQSEHGGQLNDYGIINGVSQGTLQPTFRSTCPMPILMLARACLSFQAAARPSAVQLAHELRRLQQSLNSA